MTKRRTGLNTLAYTGVAASTPPQLVMHDRAPTVDDYGKFNVGTLWIHDTTPQDVWMLTKKYAKVATWLQIGGEGGIGTVFRVDGGDNINTVNPTGPTVIVHLNKSIYQPVTNVSGDEGGYFLGGNTFLHGRGTQNTFVGQSAGNLNLVALNAIGNTGVGFQALRDNLNGENNVALGESSLATIVNGDENVSAGHGNLDQATFVGYNTSIGGDGLTQLLIGDANITLGYRSGFNYVNDEASNILIGNEGTATEDNIIHIGTEGVGSGQQAETYIAGIYQSTIGMTRELVFVDDVGQIGSSPGVGDDGEVLIGATGASGAWDVLQSSNASININSTANAIDLTAVGAPAGGVDTFNTDVAGPALINVDTITMAGDGLIQTDGSTAHTVTFELVDGTNGQLFIAGGGVPAWNDMASAGATINITYPGANQINLEDPSAASGAITFVTDSGNAVEAAGTINVLGGDNINTAGATDEVHVHLDKSIFQPDTNASGSEGLYSLASGNRFMHNFGVSGTSYNAFLGQDAGNLTHSASVDSTGIGCESLTLLTTGIGNTSVGSGSSSTINTGSNNSSLGTDSLELLESGDNNVALGKNVLNGILTGSNNLAAGTDAGSSLTATDSSNILLSNVGSAGLNNTIMIGTDGSGAGQQDTTFIVGIHGVTPAGATQSVIIDANGQLGSAVTGVTGVLQIDGGANINTVNPNGPTVTVNLNDAVYIPATNRRWFYGQWIFDDSGVFAIDTTTRFHTFGTNNIFMGRVAGNVSLTAGTVSENIGIGDEALNAIDDIATGNVVVGNEALMELETGSYNVAIGDGAMRFVDPVVEAQGYGNVAIGTASLWRTYGGYNIGIGFAAGSPGYPGVGTTLVSSSVSIGSRQADDNTIFIGDDGTGAGQQDTTYVAGIYDKDLGGVATKQVYVTADGLLGTGGAGDSAFLAIQALDADDVTGDNTVYTLGTTTQVNEIYDVTGDYDPGGGGNPATFTAPADGLYFLEVQFLVNDLVVVGAPVDPSSEPVIDTSNRNYELANCIFLSQVNGQQSYFYNVVADMDAADTATFSIQVLFGNSTRTLDIGADQTFISGYFVMAV